MAREQFGFRPFDALANFSNKAPKYFKKMVGDNNGGFKNVDHFWRAARDSRDWRLVMSLKYGASGLSKSLFVIGEDVERVELNTSFDKLIKDGVKATGKAPIHWGE